MAKKGPKKEPRAPDLEMYLTEDKRHDFINYTQGHRIYGMPYWPFVRLAKEADAVWTLRKKAIVDMKVLDAYIEAHAVEREEWRMGRRTPIDSIEDIMKAKNKKYVRMDEAKELYSVGRHTLEKWAREAGAVRKLNNVVLINTEKLDAFIEANAEEEDY